tara:strand:- start:1183 stop:1413 length:231 start_codon:yes stop_codon:yes gene_type:complete
MVQSFMRGYPFVSVLLLFPFTLMCTIAVFSIIVNVILPSVLALWLAGLVYSSIVEQGWKQNFKEPFSFIRTRYYSV